MQRHAGHDAAHAVLADAVVQLDAAGVVPRLHGGPLDQYPVVARQVGRAGHQTGQSGRGGVDALVDGVARGQVRPRLERRQLLVPAVDAAPGLRRLPGRPVAVPGGEALLPGRPVGRAAGDLLAVEGAHLVGHPEGLVGRQPQDLLGHPDLVGAEGAAVGGRRVRQLGRGPADVAAQHEQRRPGVGAVAGELEHLADGRLQAVDVVGHFAQVAHPPAVGLEALHRVVVVGQFGRPVDGDVVVVVEHEQAPQPEVPGQRGRLVRNALHEAPVAGDHVGAVVADLGAEAGAHARARPGPGPPRRPRPARAARSSPRCRPCAGARDAPGSCCPTRRNWRMSSSERS